MKADVLYEAIGEIRDDFVLEARTRKPRARKPAFRSLIAACLMIAVLVVPVSAEVNNGYVSNLLAPLYGSAQTELVDSIGAPVGATDTVGEYTLTADAVIGDRYNVAVVFTLTRNDNGPMPKGICFRDHTMFRTGGSGGGYTSYNLSEDRTKLRITVQRSVSLGFSFFNRNASVAFVDLVYEEEESGEEILLQEGSWELAFTLRYEDTTVKIPVKGLEVTGSGGEQYRLRKLYLSPIGIHMDLTAPNPYLNGNHANPLLPGFTVSVVLKDGTVITLEDCNIATHGKQGSSTVDADYSAMFDVPIPVEEVAALIICDTMVPVEVS